MLLFATVAAGSVGSLVADIVSEEEERSDDRVKREQWKVRKGSSLMYRREKAKSRENEAAVTYR